MCFDRNSYRQTFFNMQLLVSTDSFYFKLILGHMGIFLKLGEVRKDFGGLRQLTSNFCLLSIALSVKFRLIRMDDRVVCGWINLKYNQLKPA